MAERFTWRGIPIVDEQGNVIAVQPVRAIQAENGLYYPGVLSRDAEGNAFTYNQVPGDYSPTLPRVWNDSRIWNDTEIWRDYEVA